jgi:thiol-disulfide isomerase/thioredoxin
MQGAVREVPAGPGAEDVGDAVGVGVAGQQVVGAVGALSPVSMVRCGVSASPPLTQSDAGNAEPGRAGSERMRSNRRRLPLLAVGVAALLAACGGGPSTPSDDTGSAAPAESGAPAEFTAERLGGGELASASFAGEDTVLWFWAPWCTVCRGEADDVVAAAGAFEGEVEIIGVAGRGEVPDMEGFVADTGTEGLTHVIDDDGSIWSSYDVFAQPAYAFIDDSGTVEVFVGALGEDALIERMTALAGA